MLSIQLSLPNSVLNRIRLGGYEGDLPCTSNTTSTLWNCQVPAQTTKEEYLIQYLPVPYFSGDIPVDLYVLVIERDTYKKFDTKCLEQFKFNTSEMLSFCGSKNKRGMALNQK